MGNNVIVFDIEATNLLNEKSIDYSQYPLRLKKDFLVHCLVAKNITTGEITKLYQDSLTKDNVEQVLGDADVLIAHNGIGYDLPVLMLYYGFDYSLASTEQEQDYFNGKPCEIVDTAVLSRTLWPDRPWGHSLDGWGKHLGFHKGDYGKEQGAWKHFNHRMLAYCVQDVELNQKVYENLLKEKGKWPWEKALVMEKAIAEIITRQEHFGFKFNIEKAEAVLSDLNTRMQEIEEKVEPLLPAKKISKTEAKKFVPPKLQFKKNGEPSANMEKFAERLGASIEKSEDGYVFHYKGQTHPMPLPAEPLEDTQPMTLAHQKELKEYLVTLGWEPTVWAENDLTVDQKKKKKPIDKYKESVLRYCHETKASPFKRFRLEHMQAQNVKDLYRKLMTADRDRPVKVITSPKYTVNQDKDLCPSLEKLGDKVSFVNDVVHWLTYRHRRNSVKSPNGTGFLVQPRIHVDGRIQTPAITCGAATSRFTHNVVCNIPRATSLYGKPIRELFGCSEGFYQIGCDAAGLEARVEGHYALPYDESGEYVNALLSEKPNDIHCFSEDTEILTSSGWKTFNKITKETKVAQWDDKEVTFVEPDNVIWRWYEGEMVHIKGRDTDQLVTPEHRVLVTQDRSGNHRVVKAKDLKHCSVWRLPLAGFLSQTNKGFDLGLAKLLVATQADGFLEKDCNAIRFTFCRKDKLQRLKDLIEAKGLDYTETSSFRKGRYEYSVRILAKDGGVIREHLSLEKEIEQSYILSCDSSEAEELLEEFFLWDGWKSKKGNHWFIDQTSENNRDLVSTLGALCGYKVSCNEYQRTSSYGTCRIYRACLCRKVKPWAGLLRTEIKKTYYQGYVGCVSVPSSFVVVRRKGKVFVSGNSVTARKMGIDRDDAKSLKYASAYGAQPPKIAKQMGWPLSKAKKAFNQYWESAYPIKELKKRVENYWEKHGNKKYIKGIDGRKLFSRSKHSLLNLLFQNCGAVIMKQAAVMLDRELQRKGLLFNPFVDDSMYGKCAEMIHYQDEYQFQVHPSLISIEEFDTKEEANAFCEQNPEYDANIGELDGVWIAAKSEVGRDMSRFIGEAARYYGTRVEFTGDYDIGRNWAECH